MFRKSMSSLTDGEITENVAKFGLKALSFWRDLEIGLKMKLKFRAKSCDLKKKKKNFICGGKPLSALPLRKFLCLSYKIFI